MRSQDDAARPTERIMPDFARAPKNLEKNVEFHGYYAMIMATDVNDVRISQEGTVFLK